MSTTSASSPSNFAHSMKNLAEMHSSIAAIASTDRIAIAGSMVKSTAAQIARRLDDYHREARTSHERTMGGIGWPHLHLDTTPAEGRVTLNNGDGTQIDLSVNGVKKGASRFIDHPGNDPKFSFAAFGPEAIINATASWSPTGRTVLSVQKTATGKQPLAAGLGCLDSQWLVRVLARDPEPHRQHLESVVSTLAESARVMKAVLELPPAQAETVLKELENKGCGEDAAVGLVTPEQILAYNTIFSKTFEARLLEATSALEMGGLRVVATIELSHYTDVEQFITGARYMSADWRDYDKADTLKVPSDWTAQSLGDDRLNFPVKVDVATLLQWCGLEGLDKKIDLGFLEPECEVPIQHRLSDPEAKVKILGVIKSDQDGAVKLVFSSKQAEVEIPKMGQGGGPAATVYGYQAQLYVAPESTEGLLEHIREVMRKEAKAKRMKEIYDAKLAENKVGDDQVSQRRDAIRIEQRMSKEALRAVVGDKIDEFVETEYARLKELLAGSYGALTLAHSDSEAVKRIILGQLTNFESLLRSAGLLPTQVRDTRQALLQDAISEADNEFAVVPK